MINWLSLWIREKKKKTKFSCISISNWHRRRWIAHIVWTDDSRLLQEWRDSWWWLDDDALVFQDASVEDTDAYHCTGTNKLGKETVSGHVTVRSESTMDSTTFSFLHSFIHISIAPLQVHYYSAALPIQHKYVVVTRRSVTGNCEWRTWPRSLRGS